MYVSMCVCVYIYISIHIYVYVYMYGYMCVIYTHANVCFYTYVQKHCRTQNPRPQSNSSGLTILDAKVKTISKRLDDE